MYSSVYNVLVWTGLSCGFPLALFKPKIKHYFKYRLGSTLDKACPRALGSKPVWIQALSVGEVLSALPLISLLKMHNLSIFFTASTLTGHTIASQKLKHMVKGIGYFPLDLAPIINRYLYRIKPHVVVLVETDIWPNFLHCIKRYSIPCLLINARISHKSYKRYRLIRPFFKKIINLFDFIGTQRAEDAERLKSLGTSSSKLKVMGNMKFDCLIPKFKKGEQMALHKQLGLSSGQKIWVAGSTHKGEDEIIFSVLKHLLKAHPEICLIIAPRHPERFDEVEKLARKWDFKLKRRTKPNKKGTCEVIILDTIGELTTIYGLADFVFIGGSLIPIGGHNPLEAASWGRLIAFGPYMFNFSEIKRLMLENEAAISVNNENELTKVMEDWLNFPEEAKAIGDRALGLVKAHQGATDRYFKLIKKYL